LGLLEDGMFLVALTTKDLNGEFRADHARTIRYNDFFATVLTDGWLSSLHTSQDGFRVVETLPASKDLTPPAKPLLEFVYDARRGRATLSQEAAFGRPVYYHQSSRGEFFCSTHISLLRRAQIPIEENLAVLPEFSYTGM
jgi:hypothetical protein